MARTTPVNSGYSIINGSTTGSNGSKVNTWIEYKVTAQSIPNNTSTVRVILYSQATTSLSTSWTVAENFGYVTYDNGVKQYLSTTYDFSGQKLNKFADYTFTIAHGANGAKSITLQGAWSTSHSTYISGGSVSGVVALPTIPRYATVNQSLGSKTETTIAIKWSADSAVDYIWYSKDNGGSWTGLSGNGTSGSYTITGLAANTAYNIKTRVRRKDSQLTTDSATLAVTTYNYPYATSMPNFTIGNALTIGFYNPLGRQFTIYLIANNVQIAASWTISGTSISGFNSASVIEMLYATIPNAASGAYMIKCVYGSSTITRAGGVMSANTSVAAPAISTLTYQDTNAAALAVTGDNQQIVRNQSTPQFTAGGLSTKYGATLKSCSIEINGASYALSINGSTAIGQGGVINSGTNVTATATLTDSRGLKATKTVTVNMLDWALPTATIALGRQSNFYSETDLRVSAQYSYLDGKNSVEISYKAKKVSESAWAINGSAQNNVKTTFEADNEYEWYVQVIIADRFGQTAYNLKLARGMPIVYFDRQKSSVGVNKFPTKEKSFEVDGDADFSKAPTINGGDFRTAIGAEQRGYGWGAQSAVKDMSIADLDNIKVTSCYTVRFTTSGAIISGYNVSYAVVATFMYATTAGIQILKQINADSALIRYLSSSVWGDWKHLTTSDSTDVITARGLDLTQRLNIKYTIPYIDFYSNNGTDYTNRIIDQGTVFDLTGNGNIRCLTKSSTGYRPILASAFTVSSSRRYKHDIKDAEAAEIAKILNAKVRTFRYNDVVTSDERIEEEPDEKKEDNPVQIGFIVEELEEAGITYPILYDEGGRAEGLDYAKLTPYLVGIIQKQQRQIEDQEIRLRRLESAMANKE